eukprot:Tbor_TRINITY_DN2433_c0_g1::TRINITY_DN2433_c0_g1_i1::g.2593::m.2593
MNKIKDARKPRYKFATKSSRPYMFSIKNCTGVRYIILCLILMTFLCFISVIISIGISVEKETTEKRNSNRETPYVSTEDVEHNIPVKKQRDMRAFIRDIRHPHIRLAVTKAPKRLEEENSKEICLTEIFEDTKNLLLQNSQPIELTLFDFRDSMDSIAEERYAIKNYRTWCEEVASRRYHLASDHNTDAKEEGSDKIFYKVVVGIPSVDSDIGARRRKLQRQTWHQFPQIYKRKSHHIHEGSSDPGDTKNSVEGHMLRNNSGFSVNRTEGSNDQNINHRNNMRERMQKTRDTMLVRYILARHPRHNYSFSDNLLEEAQQYRDVMLIEMDEGVASTNKEHSTAAHWGLAAEVGMSRKSLYWYILGPLMVGGSEYFDYIMKGDDDMFLRAPEFMHDLIFRVEPAAIKMEYMREREILQQSTNKEQISMIHSKRRERCLHLQRAHSDPNQRPDPPLVYWGNMMKWGAVKGVMSRRFFFIGGMAIVMSKQVLKLLTENSPMLYDNSGPFMYGQTSAQKKAIKDLYKTFNMDHEDVMVGRALYEMARRSTPPLGLGPDRPATAIAHDVISTNNIYPNFDLEEKWNVSSDSLLGQSRDGSVPNCGVDKQTPYVKYDIDNTNIPKIGIFSLGSPDNSHTNDIYKALGIVSFKDCRFHDVNYGSNVRHVSQKSLVIHHLREHQYYSLMGKSELILRDAPKTMVPGELNNQTLSMYNTIHSVRSTTRIIKKIFADHVIVDIC